MGPSFAGRVAIVTGGGSGLGEAIGKALAAKGTRVVLSDINLDAAQRVAGEIVDAGGVACAIQQDTAKPEESEKVVKYAVANYGALHYAVNNAGIVGAQAPVGDTDLADWSRVIDVNLNGVLYGMRYQIPAMLDTGPEQCAIVNMASIHGTVASHRQRRLYGSQACSRRADEERGGGIRTARPADQLCRTGLCRDPVVGEPPGCRSCGARRPPPLGAARPSFRSRPARVLPSIGRRVVYHGRLLPDRRRLHSDLWGSPARSWARSLMGKSSRGGSHAASLVTREPEQARR